MKHYIDDWDVIYREYDHGLVIAHFGIHPGTGSEWDVNLNKLDLVEDPREDDICPGIELSPPECHFLKINGHSWYSRYNDGTNDGAHVVDSLLYVDRQSDDDEYGKGDALILLKEADGFYIHGDHYE